MTRYSHLTDPAVPVHLSYFLFAGLWAGFVGTAVIALIAIHCMRLLVESSHHLCHVTGKETLDYGYCMDYAFKNVTGEEAGVHCSPEYWATRLPVCSFVRLRRSIPSSWERGFCS